MICCYLSRPQWVWCKPSLLYLIVTRTFIFSVREHLLASSKTLPYSMAVTYQCTFCCDHCMGPTSKSRYQQTSVSRLNLEFKILTKPGFRISPKIQLHYHFKTSAAKYWTNSCFKSCLNFNFKILTKPCGQSLNKSLGFYSINKFWVGILTR